MFYRKASAAATLQRGHVPPSFRGVHPFPLQQGSDLWAFLPQPKSTHIHKTSISHEEKLPLRRPRTPKNLNESLRFTFLFGFCFQTFGKMLCFVFKDGLLVSCGVGHWKVAWQCSLDHELSISGDYKNLRVPSVELCNLCSDLSSKPSKLNALTSVPLSIYYC